MEPNCTIELCLEARETLGLETWLGKDEEAYRRLGEEAHMRCKAIGQEPHIVTQPYMPLPYMPFRASLLSNSNM